MLFFQDANHKRHQAQFVSRGFLNQAIDESEVEFAFDWFEQLPIDRHRAPC
jgi:hypothetical protein